MKQHGQTITIYLDDVSLNEIIHSYNIWKASKKKRSKIPTNYKNLLNIKTFDFNQDIDTQLEANIWTPWTKQFNLTSLKNYFNRPNHRQYQSSTHVQLEVRTHSLDVQESVSSTYGFTVIHLCFWKPLRQFKS